MPAPPKGSVFRSLRIQRTDPSRPGSFLLLATGVTRPTTSRSIELLSVDGRTGAQKSLASDLVREDRDFLLDQQGRLHITIPNTIVPGFPHSYEYLGRTGKSFLRTLGQAVGNGAEFVVSPDSYFGEREIPLGFDPTGEVLHYASNRGRDTFGVFAHNLGTGKASGPTFEQPTFDLIGAPVDAFPPDTLVFDPRTQELVGIRYDAAMRMAAWLKPAVLSRAGRGLEDGNLPILARICPRSAPDRRGNFLRFADGLRSRPAKRACGRVREDRRVPQSSHLQLQRPPGRRSRSEGPIAPAPAIGKPAQLPALDAGREATADLLPCRSGGAQCTRPYFELRN